MMKDKKENTKDKLPTTNQAKQVIAGAVLLSIMGATFMAHGAFGDVQKPPVPSPSVTVSSSYNYDAVSLNNEQKDGLLAKAEQELQAKKQAEIAKKKAEEAKRKAEQETKSKAEAKARAEAQAKLQADNLQYRSTLSSRSDSGHGWYNPNVPMPREQQAFLYDKVKARGLDLKDTLAVILHESGFNQNQISSTNDYGYFQINIVNHADLASELGTPNAPLDPYVNIEWGTYMLSQLYQLYKSQGLTGQALKDAVWSSYNKGISGFATTGKAVEYVQGTMKAEETVNSWF
ncbi:transglycosylase SLT domain-containing protein (plasmid) [Aneurinibacillus sp. Ricciae_BoGa-3]|uniref:transglycosylase SLT domain-containing protein n=1 Tax=Aneurinibacillus sp. Ricciae_BoGa-3 TaxID=3022697 RepID=UPI0023413820|nr:transglycosylase SLT domain-containing protein [Aneurinibacillus sp. Ricciae_BoGa-3]WCK56985.1 transglycosylase SLT domain-containing protein [Aneurinibacillus sp. Ricciae_BoGa-3]